MGVDYQGLRFLLKSRRDGILFNRTVMFGRQNYSGLTAANASKVLGKYGHPIDEPAAAELIGQRYIEPLLVMLGANEVVSVDNSTYEGASIVHDMNRPLPDDLRNRFTVAIDGGTLEHIFNFPQALKNTMESVCLGGHFLGITISNGWAGHGFYQFSPELFFRAFSRENGFEVENVFICESADDEPWYKVADPLALGRRVEFKTNCQTYLLIQARRTEVCDIFAKPPQQSDYSMMWRENRPIYNGAPPRKSLLKNLIPQRIRNDLGLAKQAVRRSLNRLRLDDREAFSPFQD